MPDARSARPGRPGRRLTILIATVRDYLPAGLSSVLASGTGEGYSPEGYSPEVAALLLGAWAIATLAVGAITLHRRDPWPFDQPRRCGRSSQQPGYRRSPGERRRCASRARASAAEAP